MREMATDVERHWEGSVIGDDSEARRPAFSGNTAVPTGDREVLEIRSIGQLYEGLL